MTCPRHENRQIAGMTLARGLRALGPLHDPVVLGLARGGMPVAAEVARVLNAPLDVLVVRKIGHDFSPEWALGALAEGAPGQAPVWAGSGSCDEPELRVAVREATAEIARRARVFRAGRSRLDLKGRTAVLVDDGMATGWTLQAAALAARACGAQRVVAAIPVAPAETLARLRRQGFEVFCPCCPEPFESVGAHYRHFEQLDDEAVCALLSAQPQSPGQAPA